MAQIRRQMKDATGVGRRRKEPYKQMSFRVPPEIYNLFVEYASEDGGTITDIGMSAFNRYIDHREEQTRTAGKAVDEVMRRLVTGELDIALATRLQQLGVAVTIAPQAVASRPVEAEMEVDDYVSESGVETDESEMVSANDELPSSDEFQEWVQKQLQSGTLQEQFKRMKEREETTRTERRSTDQNVSATQTS